MRRSRSLIAALKNVSPRRSTRPPARRISLIRAAPQPRRLGQLRAATALRRLSSDAPRFSGEEGGKPEEHASRLASFVFVVAARMLMKRVRRKGFITLR